MKNGIPKSVICEAQHLIEDYGCNFRHLGKHDSNEVFQFVFPENTETGYPFIYLYNESTKVAMQLSGEDALEVILQLKC